jgi:hypothetical protein
VAVLLPPVDLWMAQKHHDMYATEIPIGPSSEHHVSETAPVNFFALPCDEHVIVLEWTSIMRHYDLRAHGSYNCQHDLSRNVGIPTRVASIHQSSSMSAAAATPSASFPLLCLSFPLPFTAGAVALCYRQMLQQQKGVQITTAWHKASADGAWVGCTDTLKYTKGN